nr:hypothetical protein GCM10020093_103610 [Planobispora longispora]
MGDRALAGGSGDADHDLGAEAVQHGAQPYGEVLQVHGGELAGAGALLQQRDQVAVPGQVELRLGLAQRGDRQRAAPHVHPEQPARVCRPLGEVQPGEGGDPVHRAPAGRQQRRPARDVLLLAPAQRLQQDLVLAAEIVEDVAAAGAHPPGELGHRHLGRAVLGDRLHRGFEHLLARALQPPPDRAARLTACHVASFR